MSNGKFTEDDYTFIPLAELEAPAGGTFFQHYVDCWWAFHPEKGAALFNPRDANGKRRYKGAGAPRCNSSEQIARMAAGRHLPWEPEIRLVRSAWVPVSINDYQG